MQFQAARGFLYGEYHELEVRWAELISRHGSMYVFSAAHMEAEVQQRLQAFEDSLKAMLDEGAVLSELRLK